MKIIGPGFWIDNSITAGVAYDKTSGWRLIKERTAEMDSRKPGLDITSDVTFKSTLMIKATFSLWDSWDIDIGIQPWLQVDLRPNRCSGSNVEITMQVGCDGSITIGEPSIKLSIDRQCQLGVCLGPYSMSMDIPTGGFLPKTYDFAIKAGTTLSGAGMSGCVPGLSSSGSSAGYGSSSSASTISSTAISRPNYNDDDPNDNTDDD